MKKDFFEGKDFGKNEFKALIPKYYPPKYKKYIKEETKLLKQKLVGSNSVLEAGVGIGRLIPELAPLVNKFVGVDNSSLMLEKSHEIAKKFFNVKIVKGNLENLDKLFSKKEFDYSLCVWNTLGNVKNETQILRQLSYVTSKSVIITVYQKNTLEDRKNWYKTIGIKISKIDAEKEVFYSESGLKSKSYNLEDIKLLAQKSKLQIKDSKILGGVILWAELINFQKK